MSATEIADYFLWSAEANMIGAALIVAGTISAGIALCLMLMRFRDVSNFVEACNNRSVTVGIAGTGLPAWAEPSDLYGNHIFAFEGEMVVCDGPHHHPICTFTATVERGEIFDPLVLKGWYQTMPVLGTTTDELGLRCEHCGGSWWLPGNHFHFKDGWR